MTARHLVLFCSLAFAAGCGTPASETTAADATSGPPSNPLEITATDSLKERLKLGEPSWTTVGITQTVAARIEVDQRRVTRVGSPVMGRIMQLAVEQGEAVRKGDILALLNSTELSDSQLDFLRALSAKQLAERAVERAVILLKSDVIGAAELQRREAELAQASAELDAARDQLELMGMPPTAIDNLQKNRQLNSVARIVASMNGTVLERRLTLGQVVQPADTAFEIADLSSLWLQADVPEQSAGNLRVGTRVEAVVAALPGVKIEGALSFVSSTVNPETRTVRVRMDLPNPDRRLKPAMLATVTLKDQPERQQVIPTTAVVRDENTEYVFVQVGEDRYVLRQVSLGAEVDGQRVLVDGVKEGEKILVDGAFHLNNERRRQLLRNSDEA
ncbi:MAG: efflux RND transporter periplasmic adaptor subunit [Vicinamibacterales bacterium]